MTHLRNYARNIFLTIAVITLTIYAGALVYTEYTSGTIGLFRTLLKIAMCAGFILWIVERLQHRTDKTAKE